ncbi:hypothetical protein [Aeromicrobium sp. 179-A 4D2 NHS]|uniref:hypothetical protein n=1 Tax=Aeromicrobium sp. 179-A 4D2 NHS TaxID=3142375 RepID=UPI0039A2032E
MADVKDWHQSYDVDLPVPPPGHKFDIESIEPIMLTLRPIDATLSGRPRPTVVTFIDPDEFDADPVAVLETAARDLVEQWERTVAKYRKMLKIQTSFLKVNADANPTRYR